MLPKFKLARLAVRLCIQATCSRLKTTRWPTAIAPGSSSASASTWRTSRFAIFTATRTLAQYADKKVVVLAFLGTDCPLAKLYAPRLAEMAGELADKGVQFIAHRRQLARHADQLTAFAQSAQDRVSAA